MLSVIIPSRVDTYLRQTIDDLLKKAEGEVEIIVILDGYWPEFKVLDGIDKRVKIIHQGTIHANFGMRHAINTGVRIAKGEFIMKIDEHCMMDQGYDLKLAANCESDWVVIPRRRRLDPDNWRLIEDGRPPIDYMYVSYPYERPYDRSCGLYGAEDRQRGREREDILIDDNMTSQGSCWFLRRDYFWKLLPEGMDDKNYGPFNHEAQEISLNCWLSGGRHVVNKNTWYAHYHKGKRGKGYGFSNEQYKQFTAQKEKARRYAIEYWLGPRLEDFAKLLEKFWPVPTWPENWRERLITDAETDWSKDPSQQPTEWIDET